MSIRLDITTSDYAELHQHLFQPDRDEHGAIVLAGMRQAGRDLVLLAREIHRLEGPDFPEGEHGYRQFPAHVLARLGTYAADQHLAFVSCHSHPGATTRVGLSGDDLAAHRRVFPHLLDIVDGAPVAGLVFGDGSAAGELWQTGRQPAPVTGVRVVGHDIHLLSPQPPATLSRVDPRFDRQARMFGAAGQARLRALTVGVVGLGGGGSMLVEQLAHLGVGRIVAVDYDVVEVHNLSRIMGATRRDASRREKKVAVARRLVAGIDDRITFEAVDGDIADADVAERIARCDFFFLATDTATSRLVANAITHAHFVPMVQIGAKVDVRHDGQLESVYAAVRPVFPGRGCLSCAGLIDPMALQRESLDAQERRAQNYLDLPDVVDPSVVTLNGIGASAAVHTLLMTTVGLADEQLVAHRLFDASTGRWLQLSTQSDPECRWCGIDSRSRLARGDTAELPVRRGQPFRPIRRNGLAKLLRRSSR